MQVFGKLLSASIHETSKMEILSQLYSPSLGFWDRYPLAPELSVVVFDSFKQLNPPYIRGSGYVSKTLKALYGPFTIVITLKKDV